jgi:glycosyltransferase involved in cell wall biosynthesis
MGLPVIASDVSGSREFVRHGLNGWLVRPRDRENLELLMRTALRTSNSKLKQMGLEGRAMVCEYFDRKKHLERMKTFYRNL